MLVLFETSAGYAIFKLLDEKKLLKTEDLYRDFETPERASKIVKIKHFEKFEDMTEALSAATALVEGKLSKKLRKMLKKVVVSEAQDSLAVADAKLGNLIKDKLEIPCVYNTHVAELMRCIRSQMDNLITGLPQKEMTAMALGLAHSLSRYKLKFSPDKVDTMIVQAVSLLDDLDKELNNYIMRCREWYGWHFPELGKIVTDNLAFVKTVKLLGMRENTATCNFSEILPEEVEEKLKEAAEISMGTEISDEDIMNIVFLCDQVIEMTDYRTQLYEYLKNRMLAIAPNLTVLVGELVGARLIAHAGSLLNLAKQPASTVQILGAEKALFRALKTKHDTPKYGLIYHAQLVGQTSQKLKGKISRMLAAKAALAIRVDALGETTDQEMGIEHRAKLEVRLKNLEEGGTRRISGTGKAKARMEKYESKSEVRQYPVAADITQVGKKRKWEETADGAEGSAAAAGEGPSSWFAEGVKEEDDMVEKPKKKKRKVKAEPEEEPEPAMIEKPKTKKRKTSLPILKKEEPESEEEKEAEEAPVEKKKKKKKKRKSTE